MSKVVNYGLIILIQPLAPINTVQWHWIQRKRSGERNEVHRSCLQHSEDKHGEAGSPPMVSSKQVADIFQSFLW